MEKDEKKDPKAQRLRFAPVTSQQWHGAVGGLGSAEQGAEEGFESDFVWLWKWSSL